MISATDTEGIGIAMSKTASLAHSANMELETTAAFLTQIIETTQEAPEVAGTSLKTVISRFAEVKELREKGLTSGEDDEGEVVDVNKIQTALRTVGISMEDFFAGAEGLDSILLKLAEKWDSLNFETQRYIATQAAGSRQQSRFLALMSDYDRTLELVDSAYNSTGASQEQFEKTLDSLQTKLTNLENAWDEFTMGLANNDIIKGAIDLLTKILDITNKIINTLSGGNGTIKTFITALTAIGGLKLGKKGLSSLFGDKIPDSGILSKVFGKNTGKQIDKTTIGWGRESVSNFKNSFTSEIKDIFSGNKIKGKLFGNILEADTTELSKTVKTSLENLNKEGNIGKLNLDQEGYDLHWNISNGDIDSAAQSLSRLAQEGKISSNQLKELGVNLDDIDAYAQVTSGQLDKTAQTLSQVSTYSAMAGGALLAIVPILEDMGASDDAVAVIKGVATALLIFPVVLKVVEVAVHAFATSTTAAISSIPIIGWIAAAVSALIALGSVLANVIETPEEKLKKTQQKIEEAEKNLENLKSKYEELNNTIDTLSNEQNTIENLTKDTLEWKIAVQELNQEILKLLSSNPELLQYGFIKNENGMLSIDTQSEGYQKYLEDQESNISNSNDIIVANKIMEAQQQYSISKEKTDFSKNKPNNIAQNLFRENGNYSEAREELYVQKYLETTAGSADYVFSGFSQEGIRKDYQKQYGDIDKIIEEALSLGKIDSSWTNEDVKNYVQNQGQGIDEEKLTLYFTSELDWQGIVGTYLQKNILDNEIESYLLDSKQKNLEKAHISEDNYAGASAYQDAHFLEVFEEVTVDAEELDSKLKEQYAAAKEYIYKDGNFYSTNEDGTQEKVTVKDEDLINYKKFQKTNDLIIQEISDFEKTFSQLDSTTADQVESVLQYGEKGVSSLMIKENKINLNYENTGGEDVWRMSSEEFDTYLSTLYQNYNDTIKGINEDWKNFFSDSADFEWIGEDGFDISKIIKGEGDLELDLTADQLENFSTIFKDIFLSGGDVAELGESLSALLGNIKKEDLSKVLQEISETDFTSISEIEDLNNYLEDLGYEIDDNLIKKVKEVTKATSQIDLTSLENQLSSLKGVIDTVEEKISSGDVKFSKDELDTLLSIDGIDRDSFYRTDSDEYYYLGDTDTLLASLDGNVSSILTAMESEIDTQVAEGEKIDNYINSDSGWSKDGEQYTNKQALLNVVNGKWGVSDIKESALQNMARGIGINDEVVESASAEALIQGIQEKYNTFYGTGGSIYSTNLASKASFDQDYDEQKNAYNPNTNTGQDLANNSQDVAKNSLDAAINQKGLAKEAELVAKAFDKENKSFSDNEKYSKAHVLDTEESIKKFDALNDAISDNEDILKNQKGTQEFTKALSEITSFAQEAFGEDLTSDFVEKNLSDFQDMANGDEEALARIREALLDDYLNGLIKTQTKTLTECNQIRDAVSSLDDLNFDIYGNADCSQIFTELANVMGSAEAAAQVIESLGYNITWDRKITGWFPYAGAPGASPIYEYVAKVNNTAGGSSRKRKSSSGGGGGSSKKKEEKQVWENPYDELYNTLEKIEELERQRNNLEDEYDRLLSKRSTTVKDLLANQEKSLKNLQEEKKLQLQVQKAELTQVKNAKNYEYLATKKDSDGNEEQYWTTFQKEATKLGLGSLDSYAKYDATAGVVQIDYSRIEKIEDNTKTGEDQGALIEAYIAYLEENSDAYEEATDRLAEIQDEVDEINSRGIEEYLDMQTRIYDALVSQRQQEIDSMETVFEGINDSNSKILDGLQEQVDLQRQTRDNTKKEEDIADMEARLAYLRRDTSGANALEIKQLEEQLADTREEYSDSLVDQYIQNLQDQESKAQEQRQEQIDIANAQLQWMEETGAFWGEVDNLWENAFDKNGKVDENSELFDLLKDTEKFQGMSKDQQDDFIKTLVTELNEAGVGDKNLEKQQKDEELSAIKKNGKLQGAVDANGKSVGTLTKQSDGTWKTSAGNSYSSVEWSADAGAYVATDYTKAPTSNNGGNGGKEQKQEQQFPYGKASETTGNIKKGSEGKAVKAIQYALNKLGYGNSGTSSVDGKFGSNTKKAVQKFQKAMGLKQDGTVGTNTRAKFKAKGYATGGLADYTGPAWLDGTKSKPELVLNSKDTENFIVLKDVLSDALNGLSGKNSTSSSGGDNYFDINIVVDEIANDYDVDQLAKKIKKQIYDDSTYRNVNAISWIR